MSFIDWKNLLYHIDRNRIDNFIVFESALVEKELLLVSDICGEEQALVVNQLLQDWPVQRSNFLLTTLPQLLNPDATETELNPTGVNMKYLFPKFCQTIENSERLAVVINPENDENYFNLKVLIAGQSKQPASTPTGESDYWAFYLPQTFESIKQLEKNSGVQLDPQMKQMFLRANGSPDIYPYFFALEWMEKGGLANFYNDFLDRIEIKEPLERLENFVVFYEDGLGNSQGFFPEVLDANDEYRIYDWNHERLQFSVWAKDFATWLEQDR